MNLAIRGIDAQIGHGGTFHKDAHPDLKADYVLICGNIFARHKEDTREGFALLQRRDAELHQSPEGGP